MDKPRILVVEDEALAAMDMRKTLENAGYEVPDTIASGDDVLPAVLRWNPDLIIMDIRLSSFIDGVDAVERLRILSPAPVIYVTAYPGCASEDRVARTKPFAYLLKPLAPGLLRKTVDQALSREAKVLP
jgi:two-component system, response regulator PdtaR